MVGNANVAAFDTEKQRSVANHPALKQYVKELYSTLICDNRASGNNNSYEEIYNNLDDMLDVDAWHWILREMTAKGHHINFWVLENENLTLEDIKKIYPYISVTWTGFDETFKTATVKAIKKKFTNSLRTPPFDPSSITKFKLKIANTWNDSLENLLITLKEYPTEIDNPKEIEEYQKIYKDFNISFNAIKNELPALGVSITDIETTEFWAWDPDHRQVIDTVTSKMIISRLQNRVTKAKELIDGVKDAFDKVCPPMRTIFLKYPMLKRDEIEWKPSLGLLNARLKALEDQYWDTEDETELEAIQKEYDEIMWKIYLDELSTKEPQLYEYMQELYDHNFDFSLWTDTDTRGLKKYFFEKLWDIRYEQLDSEWAILLFWTDEIKFRDFFKSLFDITATTMTISGINIPVKKTIKKGENLNLKSLQDYQNFDEFPMEIEVDISDLATNNTISAEDRLLLKRLFHDISEPNSLEHDKFTVSGKNIWRLFYLYKMGEDAIFDYYKPLVAKNELNPIFWRIDKQDQIEWLKKKLGKEKTPEVTPEEELAQFYKEWDSLSWMKNTTDPDHWFKEWALIYFSMRESELPPYENPWAEWYKMQITSIDTTNHQFKAKILWSERKIEWEDTKEWWPFDMKGGWLKDKFWTPTIPWKVATKVLKEENDFNKQVELFQKNDIIKDDIFWGAKFEWWKFRFKPDLIDWWKWEEQDVAYFWSTDIVPEWEDSKLKRYNVLYKVKHNSDHTFTVESDFIHLDSHTWKSQALHHKHKMSYSDFILFMNEKKLFPKTEEQAKFELAASSDVISSKTRKWKFVSLWDIVFWIKNIWKTINDKLDERKKKQHQEFLDYLVSEKKIYSVIWNVFGFIPWIKEVSENLNNEAMLNKESNTRKAIEERINKFSKLQDFANFFSKWIDHPSGFTLNSVLWKGNTLQKILLSWKEVYNDDTLRPIMAAAMITNLKKWGWLYRELSWQDNNWLWVKCLLGKAHYQRYKDIKRQKIEKIKSGVENADQLQDQLTKLEVSYITDNIKWANWKIPREPGAVDDSNKQVLKQIYSEKFASELESAANDVTGKWAIDNKYNWIKHNNFRYAANDFKRFISSWRIEAALANLKKMGDLAKTPEHHTLLGIAMTFVTISWIMNRFCDKKTRKWFDSLARAYMIPTAYSAKKRNNQRNAVIFLDTIPTIPKFSEATHYNINDFDINSKNIPYWELFKNLTNWRSNNNVTIDTYIQNVKWRNIGGDPSLTEEERRVLGEIQKEMWKPSEDNVDQEWIDNSSITSHYPLLASHSAIDYYTQYDEDWFKWKDTDTRNNKADFRKNSLKELNKLIDDPSIDRKQKSEFLLKLFVQNFCWWESELNKLTSWLQTARMIKKYWSGEKTIDIPNVDKAGETIEFSYTHTDDDYKNLIRWVFTWNYFYRKKSVTPPKELLDFIKIFENYFMSNISNGSDWDFKSMLENAFGKNAVKNASETKKLFVPRKTYYSYVKKWSSNYFINESEEKSDKKSKREFLTRDNVINGALADMIKGLRNTLETPDMWEEKDEWNTKVDSTYWVAA